MAKPGEFIRAADVVPLTYQQLGADSSAITTVETVVGTLTFSAVNGVVYETRWSLKCVQSVGTDWFLISIREDSVTGTVLDTWAFNNNTSSYGRMWVHSINYTAASTASKSIVCTLVRGSGTGNITASAKSNWLIRRIT